MRNLLRITFLLMLTFVLVSCGDLTLDLDAPSNVTIVDGVLSWDAVEGAEQYQVAVGMNTYTITVTTFDLSAADIPEGTHEVYIVAQNDTSVSLPSSKLSYVRTVVVLYAPSNITLTGGVLTWGAVEKASSYVVVVGDDEFTVTTTTIDLNTYNIKPGTYAIHVISKDNTLVSPPSANVSYIVESADVSIIYAATLSMLDGDLGPDMTEDDFDDPWDYTYYQQLSIMANAYSTSAAAMGMSELEAIDLFEYVMDMPERMSSAESLSLMMVEIEAISDLNIDTESVAYMLIQLAKAAILISNMDYLDEISYYEERVESYEADLLALQNNTALNSLFVELSQYATVAEILLLDEFFTGEFDDFQNEALWEIDYMAYEILNYNDDMSSIYFDHNPYLLMFYNIFQAAYAAEDYAFIASFIYENPLEVLYELASTHEFLQYYTRNIDGYLDQIESNLELLAFLETEEDMLIESMQIVFDYFILVYTSIPSSTVNLLDDFILEEDDLTMEEYFMLKDEIATVLHTTMPSVDDISTTYAMLFQISSVITGVDLDAYLLFTDYFAEIDYALLDLLFTFVKEVDQQAVEDILLIADDMIIPGEFIEVTEYFQNYDYVYDPVTDTYEWVEFEDSITYSYYTNDTYDYVYVIEMMVYIGNWLEDFKTNHVAQFTEIEDLLDDDALELLFTMGAESFKDALELELDPEEFLIVEELIDLVIADFDSLKAGIDVVNSIGSNVFAEFLSTEGQMFLDLMTLINDGSGEITDTLFIADLEALLEQLFDYNTIISVELDATSIEQLLRLIRVPIAIEFYGSPIRMVFLDLFDELVEPFSEMIANVIVMENAVFLAFDALEIETLLLNANWDLESELTMMVIALLALNDAFDATLQTLYFDTLDILINDIIKHVDVLELTAMTVAEIDEIHTHLETEFEAMFIELNIVSLFDFTALTQAQIDLIHALFDPKRLEPTTVLPT